MEDCVGNSCRGQDVSEGSGKLSRAIVDLQQLSSCEPRSVRVRLKDRVDGRALDVRRLNMGGQVCLALVCGDLHGDVERLVEPIEQNEEDESLDPEGRTESPLHIASAPPEDYC